MLAVILVTFGIVVLASRASPSTRRESQSISSAFTSKPLTATLFRRRQRRARAGRRDCAAVEAREV